MPSKRLSAFSALLLNALLPLGDIERFRTLMPLPLLRIAFPRMRGRARIFTQAFADHLLPLLVGSIHRALGSEAQEYHKALVPHVWLAGFSIPRFHRRKSEFGLHHASAGCRIAALLLQKIVEQRHQLLDLPRIAFVAGARKIGLYPQQANQGKRYGQYGN